MNDVSAPHARPAVRASDAEREHTVALLWEIPRQFACPSRRLNTLPEGVQAMFDSGRFDRILCPRTESQLMYMIDIALTMEFSLAAGGAR